MLTYLAVIVAFTLGFMLSAVLGCRKVNARPKTLNSADESVVIPEKIND